MPRFGEEGEGTRFSEPLRNQRIDSKLLLSNGTELWDYLGVAQRKKNAAAVALGRLGGLKGGKARARKMTTEERAESARNAARARWAKKKKA
jgi:hypothetical protein